MSKKRVLKFIICLIVSVSIIVQCSFSSFAKVTTYFSQDSTDWATDSAHLHTGIYPDKLPAQAMGSIPEVYRHEELYGDYCIVSTNWDDDYTIMESYDFFFPLIPDSKSGRDSFGSAVFYWNDLYFLVTDFDPDYLRIVFDYDNDDYLILNKSVSYQTFNIYVLSYPFENWVFYEGRSIASTSSLISLFDFDSIRLMWSDVPIYDFVDSNTPYCDASDFNFLDILYTHEFYEYLSVSQGLLFLELNEPVTKKFSNKDLSFLFERFGFIVDSETSFVHFDYNMTMYLDKELIGVADIFEYNYQGYLTESFLEAGTAYYNTYDSRVDFSDLDFTGHNLYILVTFEFASDGTNLIFPGDFSVVSATEYFEQQENQVVINTITNGFSSVNSTIDSAVTSISSEIAHSTSAITDAVDKVSGQIEYIVSGDIDKEIPETNNEELDNLVAEQDEIIENILSSLDDDISDFVPAGYSSYKDYLLDNINSFKSDEFDNSFEFVRSTFDNIISSFSILPLVLFSLSFGFAVFALGRRLS